MGLINIKKLLSIIFMVHIFYLSSTKVEEVYYLFRLLTVDLNFPRLAALILLFHGDIQRTLVSMS